jgi:hypothetical protein
MRSTTDEEMAGEAMKAVGGEPREERDPKY